MTQSKIVFHAIHVQEKNEFYEKVKLTNFPFYVDEQTISRKLLALFKI